MDYVDQAISKNFHNTKVSWLKELDYLDFERCADDKQIFLYGPGKLTMLFWLRYRNRISVAGVIDRNPLNISLDNQKLLETLSNSDDKVKIISFDEFFRIKEIKDTVILVLSIRYYEEICIYLKQNGFKYVYPLLIMEYNRRIKDGEALNEHMPLYDLYLEELNKENIFANKILIDIGIHGEHGRAITRALLNSEQHKWDIVWIVSSIDENCPKAVRMINREDRVVFEYELSTSHVVLVDTVDFSRNLRKKEGQIFIQLKHWSSITLKRFGLEDAAQISEEYYNAVLKSSKLTDYVFTGSDFDDRSCEIGFGKDISCIRVGSPRSDILFAHDKSDEIKVKVGREKNKHIIMYAPTFRTGDDGGAYSLSTRISVREITKALTKRMGGKWEFWLRLHPLIQKDRRIDFADEVVNVSDYPSVQELVAAADVLITDYSSVMFEPAYVYKPVFLFAPDRDTYVNIEKELLIEYDSLPFPIATNNEQLSDLIEKFDETEYHNKLSAFFDKYGVHEDGHASERAADFIISLCGEELDD